MKSRIVIERYLEEALGGVGGEDAIAALVSSPELRQRTAHIRDAFPDLAVTTDVLLADGDLVAAHFTARGTHRGLWNGVPPTGNEWEARCTAIYRVEAGRIAEAWVTWDSLSLLEQLGAIARVATVSA